MKDKDAYIGQRVVWLGKGASEYWPSQIKEGATGTVVEIIPNNDGFIIGVKWDDFVNGHSLHGKVEHGYGYYMHPKGIASISESPTEIKVAFDDLFERSK